MKKTRHERINNAIASYHAECIRTDIDNDVLNGVFDKVGVKRVYTSNYSRCGGNENAVSISASAPDYFRGRRVAHLAPSWDILNSFKAGKIDEQEYALRYLTLLEQRGLNPEVVYDTIPHGTILLCYEKPGDFCHRRVLADWLEVTLGVKIPEWETEEERKKSAIVDSLLNF